MLPARLQRAMYRVDPLPLELRREAVRCEGHVHFLLKDVHLALLKPIEAVALEEDVLRVGERHEVVLVLVLLQPFGEDGDASRLNCLLVQLAIDGVQR